MPKRTTDKTKPAPPIDDDLPFEEALARLEALVEEMEQDQLPLERLVEHYEKGTRLLAHCEKVLASARKRLQTITLQNQGEAGLPADEAAGNHDDAPDPGDDDELRLI